MTLDEALLNSEEVIKQRDHFLSLVKTYEALLEVTKQRDYFLSLIKTYKNMPFPCHDYMTRQQWEDICLLCKPNEDLEQMSLEEERLKSDG